MNTRELKSLYYGKLSVDPDSPVWEEFEYRPQNNEKWIRFPCEIRGCDFDTLEIRHNPKPKKWMPVGGNYYISIPNNDVFKESVVCEDAIQNGLTRINQEQAEQDLKQIRQFCRFLAWRAENRCYTDNILPALDYAGCFLNKTDYSMLKILIDSGEVEL